MPKFLVLLFLVVLGGAVLAPIFMMMGLDPVPGDFTLEWQGRSHAVPAVYSLCASAGLTLLYWVMKR